jgi:hypothetical protein
MPFILMSSMNALVGQSADGLASADSTTLLADRAALTVAAVRTHWAADAHELAVLHASARLQEMLARPTTLDLRAALTGAWIQAGLASRAARTTADAGRRTALTIDTRAGTAHSVAAG